jgi:hypothetical protein
MRILVACERSGVVRDAFRKRGHDVWSCDLVESYVSGGPHYACDVRLLLKEGWDRLIAHPDCTYLCSSGLHWNGRGRGHEKTEEALDFVRELLGAPIHQICIENPVGCIGTRIRTADQYIQPYEFNEDASKKTGLWLKNLPLLVPTRYVPPRITEDGKQRWSNQTDSGQNRLGPSEERAMERARTYHGVAEAMAAQWK